MIQLNTISVTKPLFDYLNKRRQNLKFIQTVELAATFFLISFFLLFAIKPTVFTISSLLGDIKSKEVLSRKQLKPKINQVIQAQDTFVQIQQDYYLIESSFPDNPSYSHAATQIRGTGQQFQIFLNRISFNLPQDNKSKNKSPVKTYHVSMGQSTQFGQVASFVQQLLENRRLIDIKKISLTKKDSSGSFNQIDFNLSADILFWQQDEEK